MFTREIKILLTNKNLLLVKKKISTQGDLKLFIPSIPLGLSDQPVRVLHSKFFSLYHHVEMNLKNFFGKRTVKCKKNKGSIQEVFPYHVDITNQKNLENIYEFLKGFHLENFNFLNFRWFDLSQKDRSLFTDDDKKIIDELSIRIMYGEENHTNAIIKKFVYSRSQSSSRDLH